MAGKTAFVTGGTGFVGLNLVDHLTQSGWDVTALHRPSSDLSHLKRYPVRFVEGAIEDEASLTAVVPADVAAVFHVAGNTSMWPGDKTRQWQTNVVGTRNMVNAALKKGARKFIHTSTSGVYGLPLQPFDETAPKLGKFSFNYQRSKAFAEDEVLSGVERGLQAVILNPANIIGRLDWTSWSKFIKKAANREMPLIPPGSACFCDVRSVVLAHVTAVERGRIGHNYLLGGPHAKYAEVVKIVGQTLQRPMERRVGWSPAFRLAGRSLDWVSKATRRQPMITGETAAFLSSHIVCRSDKAMRDLDYRPVTLEAMLRECIEWMAAEGQLGTTTSA